MLHTIWNNILYRPLINILALIISVMPGGDVGLAVIILTVLVKLALFPLSKRSIESQAKMNVLAPELDRLKKSGLSKEEQAKQTFELYKKYKTNPFSGCLLVLIQIPIILALYYSFRALNFDNSVLYSFVHIPAHINNTFLGLLDLTKKSLILAILAGVSQFLQAYYMPKTLPSTASKNPSFQENLSKSMQMQMKYVFPFLIAFIAYSVSGAIALYWITSNLMSVAQQIYLRRKEHLDVESKVRVD